MRAEGLLAGRLGCVQAHAGLEPLAVGVDQADQRDGDAELLGGELDDAIEAFLGRRVQDEQLSQRLEPIGA